MNNHDMQDTGIVQISSSFGRLLPCPCHPSMLHQVKASRDSIVGVNRGSEGALGQGP